METSPLYQRLMEQDWHKKIEVANALLADCRCCPRQCRVNRLAGEKGVCRAGAEMVVASADAHFGEEPPISGWKGSGTIFFTYCPMRCVYCQNYPFSQLGQGRQKKVEEVTSLMLALQEKGCHNINLVTPAHFMPLVIQALHKAAGLGLSIPIVYNTSSYESAEVLSLLEGVVDIYLADMRYDDPEMSSRYSGAEDYPHVCRSAIREMFRQVGHLVMDGEGIAYRGLIIRHLVLPNRIAGSRGVFTFIAREISTEVHISLMSQYYPAYQASQYPELNRRITHQECREALEWLEESGLAEGWRQEVEMDR